MLEISEQQDVPDMLNYYFFNQLPTFLYGGAIMTFGEFIKEKRLAQGITLRGLAAEIGIAPAYMSDIEKGHRYPPDKNRLYDIAKALHFSNETRDIMFDLAGRAKENSVSPDLPAYIMANSQVRVALRMARDSGMGNDFWQTLIDQMESERRRENK